MNTQQFASGGTSEFPSLWFFPSIWPAEENNSTVIQKCLSLMQMSQLWHKCLSHSVLLPPPFLFLALPYTVWLSLRSEVRQYNLKSVGQDFSDVLVLGQILLGSIWILSSGCSLVYYKYLQNREFGPNIAKYLQSLYVWGSGSICRYLKIF